MKTSVLHRKKNFFTNALIWGVFVFFALLSSKPSFAQTGEMLNFDGTDDYVDLFPNFLSATYTKEAWIRVPVIDGGTHNIMSGSQTALYIAANGFLSAGNYPGFLQVQDPNPIVANTWYHVAVTFDTTTGVMALYKNGTQVNSATAPSATEVNGLIGAIYTGVFGYFFQGDIDEVRLWSVARTATQIQDNYQCIIDKNTHGLFAYYDFNQGTAGGDNTSITELVDRGPNGYDGSLSGFTLDGTSSNFLAPGPVLHGPCAVVPVSLTSFTAVTANQTVKLKWQTASEMNNSGFSVQRSDDGSSHWKQIGFVKGSGTTSTPNTYNFTDQSPNAGVNYYRLDQQDFDGAHAYSPVAVADFSGEKVNLTLYPTVAHDIVTINVSDRGLLNTQIMILDNQGKVVHKMLLNQLKQTINISKLQDGLYFLKTQGGKAIKFIKR